MIDKIAEWIDWLRIASSPMTVSAYEWELRHLEKWTADTADTAEGTGDVLILTAGQLARYLAERRTLQHCGDAAVRRSVNALRSFYRYALGEKRSPMRNIQAPSVKRKRQRTLNGVQALAVMAAPDTSSARGKRDLAIICLGLSSGLRESELCHLRVSEVDMEHHRLTTRVKGGNDGDGVFGGDTAAALASWLAIRPAYARSGVETVFVGVGGIKPGTAITPSGLRVIFRKIGQAAGLEHFSPHDLRRSFATLSHRFGAPSRIVQVAGRWNDLRQVEGYTQALEAEDFAPYDPVSRLLA